MNKLFSILVFSVIIANTHGQEKYALVIGNSNYTNFGKLQNPINDANDMKNVLESLDFNVDILLDGSLSQMENSAIRLRNHLSEAGNNSIGFFYYAGHGLEMDGVNYLIPANANIPDRLFLRERAFSVQIMLDVLNESRNTLNIVVLDACRDFPAAWSRSLNRGLVPVTNPPANHIIMYATGVGAVASDGTGRNGLFTSHLLNNLKQTYDINEIFRRTMVDVSRASNNEQRPALYTDYGETMYFRSGNDQVQIEQNQIYQNNTSQVQIISAPIDEEEEKFGISLCTRFGTTIFAGENNFNFAAMIDLKFGYLFSTLLEGEIAIIPADFYIQNNLEIRDIYALTIFRVNVLPKIDFSLKKFEISPFIGIGFNVWIDEKDYVITPLLSGIMGLNISYLPGSTRRWIIFSDFRVLLDFDETKTKDNSDRIYNSPQWNISLGIKYFIPF